jgi:Heavy metal associated domain 2
MHATIAHHSARRIRLRIPEAKNNPEFLRRIASQARQINGVHTTEFNPTTGSVLINFTERALADLAPFIEFLGEPEFGLDLIKPFIIDSIAERSELSESLGMLLRDTNTAVKAATSNNIDLNVLLPVSAAVCGLVYFSQNSVPTPLWVTLMIFAFNSFIALNRPVEERPEHAHQENPPHLDI